MYRHLWGPAVSQTVNKQGTYFAMGRLHKAKEYVPAQIIYLITTRSMSYVKMTEETPKVRSDKRKPRKDRQNHRQRKREKKEKEKEREKERKERKREKKRERREK